MSTRTRVSLHLPSSLKVAAEEFAAREGVSLNQFIGLAVAEKIGSWKAAAFFEGRGRGGEPARAVRLLRSAPDVEPEDWDRL